MVNILIVDDELNILDLEKRVVQRYFKQNDIQEYEIDTAINGEKAIKLMNTKTYNLIFLDYMMPKANGVDVLKSIRVEHKDEHQPFICMVTAMGTLENLELFKKNKASSYVLKPFNIKTINLMLDTYIKPIIEEKKQKVDVEEFIDFEDFDDDEEFDISDDEKEQMGQSNLDHKQVSAQQYLKEMDNLEYILEDINEIDELLSEIIDSLDIEVFDTFKSDITTALNLYGTFLRGLYDLDRVADTVELTKELIGSIDIENYNEKKQQYIIETIRAILNDLVEWKNSVFVKRDAVDVYYLVASNYNSYIILKDLSLKVK